MLSMILEIRIWKLLCSLKMTIVLASVAAFLTIGGSVLIPFNPIFSTLDTMPLGQWITNVASQSFAVSWWIPVSGVLVVLLGINTLCCFIDWLLHIRARWRKTGEYLIHLGFILILIAFLWGSQSGFRSEKNGVLLGQALQIKELNVSVTLEGVKPLPNAQGIPMDTLTTLALYQEGQLIKRVQARANHPLIWNGLLVIPSSYGRTMWNGRAATYSLLTINYDPGAGLAFVGSMLMGTGVLLALVSFYRKRNRGDRPDVV